MRFQWIRPRVSEYVPSSFLSGIGFHSDLTGAVYYQRWRPPPPRLPRSPPPPKPLPPPPPSRGAIGRASLTVTDRPSKSAPLNFVIASAASCSVDISTNPKPLLRPVSRSVTILADST